MTRTWLGSVATAMMGVLACGLDTSGVGDGTGDTSGTSGTSGASSTTSPTTTPTGSASAEATSVTTVAETGPGDTSSADTSSAGTSSAGTDATTEAETSATGTSESTGGSSTGEPPADEYPACVADEDCTDPYALCWPPMEFGTPNFCTLECANADECPIPTSGMATPVCEGPPGTNICVLDCTDADCPDDMNCVDVFGDGNYMRCTRA